MATFEYDGNVVPALWPRDLTIAEAEVVRDGWGIPGIGALERGVADFEPDAWRALLAVSARRVVGTVDPYHAALEAVRPVVLAEAMKDDPAGGIDAAIAEDIAAREGARDADEEPPPEPAGASV